MEGYYIVGDLRIVLLKSRVFGGSFMGVVDGEVIESVE